MQPPPCFSHSPHQVCLHHALYGLKQAPCIWFEKFHSAILQLDFIQSLADHAIYFHTSRRCTVLVLYVNDMIITGDNVVFLQYTKTLLHRWFKIKIWDTFVTFLVLKLYMDLVAIYLLSRSIQ